MPQWCNFSNKGRQVRSKPLADIQVLKMVHNKLLTWCMLVSHARVKAVKLAAYALPCIFTPGCTPTSSTTTAPEDRELAQPTLAVDHLHPTSVPLPISTPALCWTISTVMPHTLHQMLGSMH